jgi:hypothetical protein
MDRRKFTGALLAGMAVMAGTVWMRPAWALNESTAASAVRAALERGARAAVATLGRSDGFLGNPLVRIGLPGQLEQAARLLKATGQRKRVEALEVAMNRAAEQAVPAAQDVLVSTVKQLSVEDALKLVRGGDTAVTDFFSAKTRTPLAERFLPIVTRATERVDLAARYNAVAGKAAGLGLVQGDEASIERYVTARALDGLYKMIGEEEKRIRADPVGTGSALLRQVFGR